MKPFRLPMNAVPTTLTLKNIPDDLYAALKQSAEVHRRSLNSEAIACLESVLQGRRLSTSERLHRIRALRAELPQKGFRASEIDALKRRGRS
jgi:plasmid stability protein